MNLSGLCRGGFTRPSWVSFYSELRACPPRLCGPLSRKKNPPNHGGPLSENSYSSSHSVLSVSSVVKCLIFPPQPPSPPPSVTAAPRPPETPYSKTFLLPLQTQTTLVPSPPAYPARIQFSLSPFSRCTHSRPGTSAPRATSPPAAPPRHARSRSTIASNT